MKMYFKNLIFALAGALAMTACSNEMEQQLAEGSGNSGQEVKFTVGIENLSRTAIAEGEGVLKTTFVNEDAIGIFAYKEGETEPAYTNVKYTYNGSAWTSEQAITSDGTKLSYYAYYPYMDEVTDPSQLNITVNADQTSGFSKDDVLTAQNTTAEAGSKNVTLSFKHAFAMVQVGIKSDLTTDAEATVTLESILPTAVVNAKAGTVGTASGEKTSIQMQKTSADKWEYRAIVPAQDIASGGKLLTIVAGGKTYAVTYSSTENQVVSYVAGKALQITVNSLVALPEGNEVTIGGSITDWDASTSDPGEGDVDRVYSDLIPLKLKDISSSNFRALTADPKQANYTESFWFSEIKSTDATVCELVSDDTYGNVIKIDYKGEGSWYDNFVGYFNPNKENIIEPNKIYTLSFRAKADIADAQIWTCIKLPTENYFCSLEATTTDNITTEKNQTFKNFTLSTDWKEFSCNFKFSLLGNKSGSGNKCDAYKEWADVSVYDYYINLAPRSKNTIFYITDVILIENE